VVALALTEALSSHAASQPGRMILLVAADTLHLLAAGIWAGGLLALALAVLPMLRRENESAVLAWAILRRFGALAAASLAVLAVTGLYAGGQQVASLDALLTTLYGQSLLVKIGLAIGAALLGLLNAGTLHPRVAALLPKRRRGPRPLISLARRVLLEGIGAALILLLASLLGATQPARGPAFDPPAPQPTPETITTSAADLIVMLSVKPNQPGQNFMAINVFNTRRPAPAPIQRVAVELQSPGQPGARRLLAVAPLDGAHYQIAGETIDTAGNWAFTVLIDRPGLAEARVRIPWAVQPATAAQAGPAWISNQPLGPALTLAAGLLLLGLAGAGAALWALRRWPRQYRRATIALTPVPSTNKKARS